MSDAKVMPSSIGDDEKDKKGGAKPPLSQPEALSQIAQKKLDERKNAAELSATSTIDHCNEGSPGCDCVGAQQPPITEEDHAPSSRRSSAGMLTVPSLERRRSSGFMYSSSDFLMLESNKKGKKRSDKHWRLMVRYL